MSLQSGLKGSRDIAKELAVLSRMLVDIRAVRRTYVSLSPVHIPTEVAQSIRQACDDLSLTILTKAKDCLLEDMCAEWFPEDISTRPT